MINMRNDRKVSYVFGQRAKPTFPYIQSGETLGLTALFLNRFYNTPPRDAPFKENFILNQHKRQGTSVCEPTQGFCIIFAILDIYITHRGLTSVALGKHLLIKVGNLRRRLSGASGGTK